jgi:GH35 family endo-1,4-beta-xylanase
MTKLKVLFLLILLSILLSGCTLFDRPTENFYQRVDGDILRQHTIYIPFVVGAERVPLGSAIHPGFMWDKRYVETLGNSYERVTPEVAGGYWWIVGSATDPAYPPHGWADMDATYQYALSNGKAIHSYPLRWWFPNAIIQPRDITAWITEVMTRYPLIVDWIVVNEGWTHYGYCTYTIPLIDESYQIARSVRPDARLWYNGLLFTSGEQQQAIRLVELGLADVIGIQMHNNLDTDYATYTPLLEWIRDNDVPWQITELDISIPTNTPDMLQRQAEAYAEVYQLCLEYNCEAITMWGVGDNVSWLYAYFPLPFDREYLPKPAWFVLSANEE